MCTMAKVGMSTDRTHLVGWYFDPWHGGCLRRVRWLAEGRFRIDGVYGSDEPDTGGAWYADATVQRVREGEYLLAVDFAGKPHHPGVRHAVYRRRRLHWKDGNVWTQLYVHRNQLR